MIENVVDAAIEKAVANISDKIDKIDHRVDSALQISTEIGMAVANLSDVVDRLINIIPNPSAAAPITNHEALVYCHTTPCVNKVPKCPRIHVRTSKIQKKIQGEGMPLATSH